MDYPQGERAITHHAGPVRIGGYVDIHMCKYIIQIALNILPKGRKCRKKTWLDLALHLHAVDELLIKCSYVGTVNGTSDCDFV
jgi:hypothetical protein